MGIDKLSVPGVLVLHEVCEQNRQETFQLSLLLNVLPLTSKTECFAGDFVLLFLN